jgi:toxin-antitoxin system PIN domain toxin
MRQTMTPDVNLLVAASRSDHPCHQQTFTWLTNAQAACDTGGTLYILPMVAAGFLRLVTHPKVFKQPTAMSAAVAFIDALLATPGIEIPSLGPEWRAFRHLCLSGKLSGNTVPDAWIAAAVKTIGSHLVTFDKDFAVLLPKSDVTILVPT